MFIAHTYYTAGMHDLAKTFVESFCLHHADDHIPLFIDAVGIKDPMRDDLIYRYPFTKIRRRDFNLTKMSKRAKVSVAKLERWREEVEHGYVSQENKAWKLMVAGEERVLRLHNMIQHLKDEPQTLIVHFDIDTLFRANIKSIIDEMKGYEVGLKLRPKINPIKARITIDMIAIFPTPNTRYWLSDWIRIACMVPPLERPIGWGQTSCWQAYQSAIKDKRLEALRLPVKYGLPGRNKPKDAIWCGNVHKLRKDDCAKLFQKEIDRMKGKPQNEQG